MCFSSFARIKLQVEKASQFFVQNIDDVPMREFSIRPNGNVHQYYSRYVDCESMRILFFFLECALKYRIILHICSKCHMNYINILYKIYI